MSSLFTHGERKRVFYFKVGGGGGTEAVNEVAKIKGSRIRGEKKGGGRRGADWLGVGTVRVYRKRKFAIFGAVVIETVKQNIKRLIRRRPKELNGK